MNLEYYLNLIDTLNQKKSEQLDDEKQHVIEELENLLQSARESLLTHQNASLQLETLEIQRKDLKALNTALIQHINNEFTQLKTLIPETYNYTTQLSAIESTLADTEQSHEIIKEIQELKQAIPQTKDYTDNIQHIIDTISNDTSALELSRIAYQLTTLTDNIQKEIRSIKSSIGQKLDKIAAIINTTIEKPIKTTYRRKGDKITAVIEQYETHKITYTWKYTTSGELAEVVTTKT